MWVVFCGFIMPQIAQSFRLGLFNIEISGLVFWQCCFWERLRTDSMFLEQAESIKSHSFVERFCMELIPVNDIVHNLNRMMNLCEGFKQKNINFNYVVVENQKLF